MNGSVLEISKIEAANAVPTNQSTECQHIIRIISSPHNSFAVCYLANIVPSHSFRIVNYNAILSIKFFNFLLAETTGPCLTVL